jgi:hypothetical protein
MESTVGVRFNRNINLWSPTMNVAESRTLLDEITDFILSAPTPERIIAYKPPAYLDEHLQYLMDVNNAGTITTEEEQELEDFVRFGHLLAMLKAKAYIQISKQP